jgi:hypothetical protein
MAAGIPRHLIARRHIDDGAAERLADRIEAAIGA